MFAVQQHEEIEATKVKFSLTRLIIRLQGKAIYKLKF